MHINYLLNVFSGHAERDALVWKGRVYSYAWLLDAVSRWERYLEEERIDRGSIVSLDADFSPNAIGILLALAQRDCIVVPLTRTVRNQKVEFRDTAQVEVIVEVDDAEEVRARHTGVHVTHPLLLQLKRQKHPGLVLFSSGSTGKSKAALHDLVPLLEKYSTPRHTLRTMAFLLFDHIGGLNTLLYNLSNAGCIVVVQDRSPDTVCEAIETYKVQLLPTSPTFVNLLLVSEAYRRYDLSSLEMMTYGTEVMPESTLRRCHELFPNVRLLQTYGLSEVGILRSKSRANDSLWIKIGGDGFETRVVDGMLEIKAKSAMLGYLNAPSPFTDDGWFKTGDAVEVDGEYLRIFGRKSELINVGGEKVYPAEVESVLQSMAHVQDAAVSGESHPITGQIVAARVRLSGSETIAEFRKRMFEHCRERLPRYKIPQKIYLVSEDMHGERFKKLRKTDSN